MLRRQQYPEKAIDLVNEASDELAYKSLAADFDWICGQPDSSSQSAHVVETLDSNFVLWEFIS